MKKELTKKQVETLLSILKSRFDKNMQRHRDLKWADVLDRLTKNPDKLFILNEMERTGGEPDVVEFDSVAGAYVFCDCSPESPSGRRSLCYDRQALNDRKLHKPENSAVDVAAAIGIELLTEAEYRALQKLGSFDTKTSSWIKTPDSIRELGGALFCDKRYNQVFVYHNGADSYYGARAFRGSLKV